MSSVFGKKRVKNIKKRARRKAVSVMGGQRGIFCSLRAEAPCGTVPLFQSVCTGGHAPTGADTAREIGCQIVCEMRSSECAIWCPILSRGNPKGGIGPSGNCRAGLFPSLIIRYSTAPGPATAGGRGRFHRPPGRRGCRPGRWRRRQTPRWHRRTCSWKAGG